MGSIPACLISAWVVDKFGRKTALMISALPLGLPWFGMVFARSMLVLCTLRFIAGIGFTLALTVNISFTIKQSKQKIIF